MGVPWISLGLTLCILSSVVVLDMAPTFVSERNRLRQNTELKASYITNERDLQSKYPLEEISKTYQQYQDDVSRGFFWPAIHYMGEHSATCSGVRNILSVVFGRNVIQRFLSPKDTFEYIAAWVTSMIAIVTFIIVGCNMVFNIVVAKEQSRLKKAKAQTRLKIAEIKSGKPNHIKHTDHKTESWISSTVRAILGGTVLDNNNNSNNEAVAAAAAPAIEIFEKKEK